MIPLNGLLSVSAWNVFAWLVNWCISMNFHVSDQIQPLAQTNRGLKQKGISRIPNKLPGSWALDYSVVITCMVVCQRNLLISCSGTDTFFFFAKLLRPLQNIKTSFQVKDVFALNFILFFCFFSIINVNFSSFLTDFLWQCTQPVCHL